MEWIFTYMEWLFCGLAGLILLVFYIRQKKRIRTFLLGSVCGVSTLTLLHFFGGFIGYAPTLSLFNLMLSALLGVPAVGMLYAAELILS